MFRLRSLLANLHRAAFRGELALAAFLCIAAFGVSLPNDLVVETDEVTWPAETEKEVEEAEEDRVAEDPRQSGQGRQYAADHSRVARLCQTRWRNRPLPPETRSGHRLPNGLLAPPRC
jgi:hypothetical protein